MRKNNKTPQTFEEAMQELDHIVTQMEKSELPLQEMLTTYKRGTELANFCRKQLQDAQMEIKKLEKNELVDCTNEYE